MVERRRQNQKPDMSYDLDGDGVVGNRDFVLAKLFDKDQDGKLNEQERKNAEEAIRNVSQPIKHAKSVSILGNRQEAHVGSRVVRSIALIQGAPEERCYYRL